MEKCFEFEKNKGFDRVTKSIGNVLRVTAADTRTTFGTIAEINYAIVYKAICKYPVFKFNSLKSYFPNLKSTREFIMSKDYLGNIRMHITTKFENPSPDILCKACAIVLGKIATTISGIEEAYCEYCSSSEPKPFDCLLLAVL